MKKAMFIGLLLAALLLAACGGSAEPEPEGPTYSAEMLAAGEAVFGQTCFACHGPDGKGLPNLGKDLTTSEFIRDMSDEELLAYVIEGRPADDPLNTTGIAMPPKGGFDHLTNEDILNVLAYIRSLQE